MSSKESKAGVKEETAIAGTSKTDPDSPLNVSITDEGAIKVSRPKKSQSKPPKTKSKAKRPKLETSASVKSNNDDSILDKSDPDADLNLDGDPEELNEMAGEIKEELAFEDNTISLPWDNAHFSGTGGKSIIVTAFDEIALEGLDGITLEALWLRMAVSLSISRPISRNLMEFVWNNVNSHKVIRSYQLVTPRGSLNITNDIGDPGDDIYPYAPINHLDTKEVGSCSTYHDRKPIKTLEFSLAEAEALGNCLILVASQELRSCTLINPCVDPRLLDVQEALIQPQYYILEKVGRARRQGEKTTGPRSLAEVVKDPKTLFYYRNQLQGMRLVAKQNYYIKTDRNTNHMSCLIHLHRFYNEVKSQRQMIIEFIIKMIKQKPAYRMEYMELRRVLGKTIWDKYQLSKVIKSLEFRQFVKTDLMVPYRTMYPNASMVEWKHKAREKEKIVRIFELRNPNLNINSIFKDDKDDADGKDSSDSEQESEPPFGVMTTKRMYQTICEAGAEGIKMRALSYRANCDHYSCRNICKNLKALGIIDQMMQDSKRQHYMVYIASEYKKTGGIVVKPEAVNADEECMEVDDDVYDFIGDVLKVDAKTLKVKPDSGPEQVEPEPSSNKYTIIKNLKRVKDIEKLNLYFANQHSFEAGDLRPLKAPERIEITKNLKTQQFFAALLDPAKDVQPTRSISSFVPVCQFDITSSNTDRNAYNPRHVSACPTKRLLKSFKPFKFLLDPKFATKPIESYTSGNNTDIEESLSSSDDEPYEDVDSSESIASGLQATHTAARDEVPEHIRKAIIEHFELDNGRLRDKINAQFVAPAASMETDTKSSIAAEENLSAENFYNVDMEMFMGPKPHVLSITKDIQEVETMLVVSTRPEDFTMWRTLISNSLRVHRRMQVIKDAVYNQKTVIDLIKIQSIINQNERTDGNKSRVDRKSLHRIFTTLVREGEFIIIKIILKYRHVIRTKNVLTEAKSDVETLIQSIVEQFKNSFVIYAKRKLFEEEERTCEPPNKVRRRFKYNRFIGRTYGTSPKFTKMRILHEFLFYVMREFTGSPITREETRSVLLNHCDVETIDEVIKEATTLYQRDASWRMFVPPLPQHKNWPTGWALISDILLRLPVSLFVKLYNVTYIIPELPGYLNHPVRKHFIVKNLPAHIQDALLGYRKYIFSLHEVICHLAYMGLVQFGPQKMREKDQVFIYLNTKATVFDTSSSERGYHNITAKEYPQVRYDLKTAAAVDKYWSDMYYFAINTKLGNRMSVIGQSIKLEFVHAKPQLAATLKSQTVESAAMNDVGYLPGDGLGACCSDSALWLHVQKNWYWYSRPPQNNSCNLHTITGLRRKHLDEVKPVKLSDVHQPRKGKKIKVVNARKHVGTAVLRLKKSKMKQQARSMKKKVILRKVQPRKVFKKKRIRVDIIDRKILDRMGKTRAVFNAEEDKLILVCMACNDYLTAFNKKRFVGSITIRDLIHRLLPMTSKKTSLAYRRRTVQLRKRNKLDDQKDAINIKILADFYTEKHFGRLRKNLKRLSDNFVTDAQLNIAFVYLVQYAWRRHRASTRTETTDENETALKDYLKPGMIERFRVYGDKEDSFCKDPTSEEEIKLDTIQSVIHSSLGGHAQDKHWPFQLLKVYQTFTEDLLRSALVNMRDYQIISGKKIKNGREGTILMSGITYNLSFNYTFKQITQFPHCIFTEAHSIFMNMMSRFDHVKTVGLSFEKFEHGHGLGVGEFQIACPINWVFDLPEDIITLNPNMNDFSELIKELTQRYTELMKKSQETEDGTYDPEAIKHLETTLQGYIQDQHQAAIKESVETVEGVESLPVDIEPTESKEETTSQDQVKSVIVPASNTEASSSTISDQGNTPSIDTPEPIVLNLNEIADSVLDIQDEVEERAIKTTKLVDFGNYGKADRRHKSWRISDMAFMLTKGLFPELDDEERLEKLNEHFIVRYPTCRIHFDELLTRDDAIFKNWHEDIVSASDGILRKVLSDALIQNIQMDQKELNLEPDAEALANYIYSKNMLGATSADIKARFSMIDVKLLDHLIKIGLVLRAGVCNHMFVHHNYRHNWSIYLNNENPPGDNAFGGYRLRISPWMRVNGTVDDKVLDKWLTIILSHCLSYPCITFNRLAARFNIVKPVDIYYLLEMLQTLGCLRIWSYVCDDKEQDIFSDFSVAPQVPSSMLDDFDDVFVETESSVITKFGAFLNRRKTDFAYSFEEEE